MTNAPTILGFAGIAIGIGIVIAISAGLVEDYLPGGKHCPYTAKNVEKKHGLARALAYLFTAGTALAAFVTGLWLLQ